MSELPFRLNIRSRIFIFVILSIGSIIALSLILDPSRTLEQSKNLTIFLGGVLAAIIGVMLFVLHRQRRDLRNFVESMNLLILFMAAAGLTIPLLLSYNVSTSYFSIAFLIGLIGWLFFTKKIIYGDNNWHNNSTKKWALIPWYLLMGAFFPGVIYLVL